MAGFKGLRVLGFIVSGSQSFRVEVLGFWGLGSVLGARCREHRATNMEQTNFELMGILLSRYDGRATIWHASELMSFLDRKDILVN